MQSVLVRRGRIANPLFVGSNPTSAFEPHSGRLTLNDPAASSAKFVGLLAYLALHTPCAIVHIGHRPFTLYYNVIEHIK